MLLRSVLALVIGLSMMAQARTKPKGKTSAPSKKSKKARKARHHVSRDKIREKSLSAWPSKSETDTRLAKFGVPELDRLLLEHPPLGAPVADDPASNPSPASEGHRAMAFDPRDQGIASVAFSTSEATPLTKLRQVAEPYLGSPYRKGGTSPDGFDCSGFVLTVLHAFGQNLSGRSSPEFCKQGTVIDKDHLQTGDLLYFADHRRSIGHVGIYLAEGKFVHASVGAGVIVSELTEPYYRTKFKAARRLESFAQTLSSTEGLSQTP